MENNYSVYQHITPDGMYYFGATQNVERRWSNNGAEYKRTALQPYIEKFGWDNIKHIVLFKDQTRENALFIENFLIETAREDGVCINKQRSGLVSKEEGYSQRQSKQYYETNKEQILEQQKQYYEQNKQQILDKKQQYYEQNKQQIREYQQEYCQKNRDEILEQKRDYYQQNKQQILEQKQQYYEQNKQQILEQQKQYYEQNKQQIRKQHKQYYEQNKQQRREYQRKYNQRKKQEKQFKKLGCLPLW